ncbi:MAG: PAS domain S-box protein, partial [Candidatus Aminicenantes bacterium]|nr:PAS domain S-box protein [Candidatus Aminicenantes bacterium]
EIIGVGRDITERKQAEEALRLSEECYRLLAENTLDVIWIMTMDARFTYVNPAIETMFGFRPDEWIGSGLWEHCDELHFAEMKALIERETAKGPDHPGVIFETQMLRRDGSTIAVEIHGRIIFDNQGKPVSLQGVTRDITERKQAQEEILKAKKSLEVKVTEKTRELRERVAELERFHDATIEREFRVKDLRDEIERLKNKK